MSLRHQARSAAVQTLCSLQWRNQVLTDDVKKTMSEIQKEFFPSERESDFFEELVFGVIKKRSEIDPLLQEYAPKFKIANLSAVDRVIMQLGMYEMMNTETPPPIIINECVELAKEFGDEGTPKFVNGVLSAHLRKTGK